jgi:hypothetical protein
MSPETKAHNLNTTKVQKRNVKKQNSKSDVIPSKAPKGKNTPEKKAPVVKNKQSSSLIGWSLLVILACCLGVVFLLPEEYVHKDYLQRYDLNKRVSRSPRSYLGRRQAGGSGSPTAMPANWPSIDQLQFITGTLLTDPIITTAMEIVKKQVPEALLNIPPSKYINGATVTYNSDVNANCYWPATGCKRTVAGTGYIEDVYTCPNAGDWGISYDDGPTTETAKLRTELDSMNLKATFFVAGANVYQFPNEITLHDKAGHQVASHTWTHHPLTSLTNEQIVAEIKYTEAIVYKTIGKRMAYIRPPYGDVDDRVRAIANALGYRIALWDEDSNDTSGAANTLDVIKSWFTHKTGFVSLEHDINAATTLIAINALKAIQALGGTFTLKIQPVGTCNDHQWYNYIAATGGPGGGPIKNQVTAVQNTTTEATPAATVTTDPIKAAPSTQTMQILQVSPTANTSIKAAADLKMKSNLVLSISSILCLVALMGVL